MDEGGPTPAPVTDPDAAAIGAFEAALADDIETLDRMLAEDLVGDDGGRIGLVQDVLLVDDRGEPAPCADVLVPSAGRPTLTPRAARFTVGIRLPPEPPGRGGLDRLERALTTELDALRAAARAMEADLLLAGLPPTLAERDAGPDALHPDPTLAAIGRGGVADGPLEIDLQGFERLRTTHRTAVPDLAGAHLRLHWDTDAAEFASQYNLAQFLSPLLIANSACSPVLLGRRLWLSTRVGLGQTGNGRRTALRLGGRWITSPVDLAREDADTFPVHLTAPVESAGAALSRGHVPALGAMRLHARTVRRLNRLRYSVRDDEPRLRIESAIFPAGPTIADQMANIALFCGLMRAAADTFGDIASLLPFEVVRDNLTAAARLGLDAPLHWIDGHRRKAEALLHEELLPLARDGLKALEVWPAHTDRYLGLLEARLERRRSGSQWLLGALAGEDGGATRENLSRVTREWLRHQWTNEPCHAWPLEQAPPKMHSELLESLEEELLESLHDDAEGDADVSPQVWIERTQPGVVRADVRSDAEADGPAVQASVTPVPRVEVVRTPPPGGAPEAPQEDDEEPAPPHISPRPAVPLRPQGRIDPARMLMVPVVDAGQHLVGVITPESLHAATVRSRVDVHGCAVAEAMIDPPAVLQADVDPLAGIALMRLHGVECLPMVDDAGRLLGMVLESDLLRAAATVLGVRASRSAPRPKPQGDGGPSVTHGAIARQDIARQDQEEIT
jgi:CBS domain-containing protein